MLLGYAWAMQMIIEKGGKLESLYEYLACQADQTMP
jgi:hypothetical protein